MFDQEFLELWGEPVSIYTDADAREDGILIDVSGYGVQFNGKLINRLTVGVHLLLELKDKDSAIIKNRLRFIAGNSAKDREGPDAWGIFQAHPQFGNEKLWLVGNEVSG